MTPIEYFMPTCNIQWTVDFPQSFTVSPSGTGIGQNRCQNTFYQDLNPCKNVSSQRIAYW